MRLSGQTVVPLLACIAVVGCQGVPDLTGGPPSYAVRPVPNPSFAAAAVPTGGESSAVALLPDGNEALGARVALARKARQSLDIQY